MKTKDNGNSICRLPKKDLQDLCRKHGLSPYNSKPNLVYSLITYVKGAERLSFTEMKTKDRGNSFGSLPKKKLQDLCRKYGLSPYKTKPNLVNSLISYFKKADVVASEGNRYNIEESSDIRSTIGKISSSRFIARSDEKGFKQRVRSPEISFAENAFTSEITSTHEPTFQFSVSSEDGINLFVDLNSCQSDWLKSFKKEGCVCQNLKNHKFESFCQEIQCLGNKREMAGSFRRTTDSDSRFNSGHAETITCPSLCGTVDVVCQTENTDAASFGYSATTKSCDGSVEYFTCSDGKTESPPSSGTICGVQDVNIINVITSMREEEMKSVAPKTFQALEETVAINGMVIPVDDNPETTAEAVDARLSKSSPAFPEKVNFNCPADVPELKQNKNVNQNTMLCDISCFNSESQSYPPVKLTMLAHLSLETDFTEIEAADIGSQHQHASYSSSGKGCFRNLVDATESIRGQLHNACVDSCSFFLDDAPSSADEGARDSQVNRTEASREFLKKQKVHLPDGGKKRKRCDGKSGHVHHYNDERVLRSTKRLQNLPRRSPRLVSK